ncbi:MAG: aminotransferase class III-fold pyridoxal phosphate-dependent enzyme [Betaproteobacteria bacterium]|nr:aminotransferase class III-fold pyridoxal phosphate-dependent enzyme [Betaproteobacteria bacterium]
MTSTFAALAAAFLGVSVLAVAIRRRWLLSRAKHPSLAGHARIARLLARVVPHYAYDERNFFSADGAPEDVDATRRAAFDRLSILYAQRFARTMRLTQEVQNAISDMQFTAAYRVPFQFSSYTRRHLGAGAFVEASSGVTLTDLDGNVFYDLTGSYGMNVFGYDFYKACIERGVEQARDLGPVLGAYSPAIPYVVFRLRAISGLDEVSFHMSGTEAVMQAVRLARYHTGRKYLVRFCGAYHGWWGDVQPGIGNPAPAHETYTLRDMHEASLRVLETRTDIACVLVNPLQALHPNQNAPSDSSLVDSTRRAGFERTTYGAWLHALRTVCSRRNIVLIFDEVFVGFRIALGGAQEYFGVRADMVTYGKTLGGGLPVGVLCGRAALMKRYRDERPADICFARGTFNAHPYVIAAMAEFLRRIESPRILECYAHADEVWDKRADALNAALRTAGLPVRVANLSSIWTVYYTAPSRYNWMFQYYLRVEGLALSWIGTGRLIFSLNYSDAQFRAVAERFLAAAQAMARDGWWWSGPDITNESIRRGVLKEMLGVLARRVTRHAHAADPVPVETPVQPRFGAAMGSISSPRSKYSGDL